MPRRLVLAAIILTFALASPALAQPRVIEIPSYPIPGGAIPPGQIEEIRKRLKEDVELTEAQRDIKREQMKAAEVQLIVAKRKLALVEKAGNAASAQEKEEALAAVELGAAQLAVRQAELKEADLRVTHAKRRVESGVFPLVLTPVPAPKAFPPAEELAVLAAKVEKAKAGVAKAKAQQTLAKADYDRSKVAFGKGVGSQKDVDVAAARLQAADADLKAAEVQLADAEAAYKVAQPALPKVIGTPKNPQSKLPASNGFPSPQNAFALAQVDYEVANLRFEIAQVEVQQLQKLGTTGADLDAAKARLAEAKIGLTAASDKVLNAQKKIDPFAK